MSEFSVEEAQHNKGVKIKVIGCGGGGGNTINHMVKMGLNDLDLIVANTDAQAISNSLAKTKIQLGEKKTKGLGAGTLPKVGAESARESFKEIKASLSQSDIVLIASGFGGGTGTGATPVIAQTAKEIGALTVSVVTMPFTFEGKQRKRLAEAGPLELKKESDPILVTQNEKFLSIIDKKAGVKDAFKFVDDILARAVKGMTPTLLDNGDTNVDFAGVRIIMGHRGLAPMDVGSASDENAIEEALTNVMESPLLNGMDIKGTKGVTLYFKTSSNCSLFEISAAADSIQEVVDENAKTILGTMTDDTMEDRVEVTTIATGFEDRIRENEKIHNENTPKKNPYLNLEKVSGGYDEEMMNQLETPTWYRRQMD